MIRVSARRGAVGDTLTTGLLSVAPDFAPAALCTRMCRTPALSDNSGRFGHIRSNSGLMVKDNRQKTGRGGLETWGSHLSAEDC
jgi:hypothetical protein